MGALVPEEVVRATRLNPVDQALVCFQSAQGRQEILSGQAEGVLHGMMSRPEDDEGSEAPRSHNSR